jgi:phage shock protein B
MSTGAFAAAVGSIFNLFILLIPILLIVGFVLLIVFLVKAISSSSKEGGRMSPGMAGEIQHLHSTAERITERLDKLETILMDEMSGDEKQAKGAGS